MKSKTLRIVLACILGVAAVVVLFWDYISPVIFPRADYDKPEVTATAEATATPKPTQSPTKKPSATPKATPTPTPEPTPTPVNTTMKDEYAQLYEENNDLIGWLTVPGTNVDYPVVQGEDNEYYLNHNYEGKNDSQGWPFLGVEGDVLYENKNLVIHGHNQRNGRMFGTLQSYDTVTNGKTSLEFYKNNPIFTFDTIYEEGEGTYAICAVMLLNADLQYGSIFNFMYNDFSDDEHFLLFAEHIMRRSLIDTGIEIEADDQLLMLSTCTKRQLSDARLVIVGVKITEEEAEELDVSEAVINENVLMPEQWYKLYGGEAPTFED